MWLTCFIVYVPENFRDSIGFWLVSNKTVYWLVSNKTVYRIVFKQVVSCWKAQRLKIFLILIVVSSSIAASSQWKRMNRIQHPPWHSINWLLKSTNHIAIKLASTTPYMTQTTKRYFSLPNPPVFTKKPCSGGLKVLKTWRDDATNEQWSKPVRDIPLYWLVNKDPYNGLL